MHDQIAFDLFFGMVEKRFHTLKEMLCGQYTSLLYSNLWAMKVGQLGLNIQWSGAH